MKRRYLTIFAIMILASPLGLWADGTAWGEWGADELKEQLGYIPAGIREAAESGKALFADYAIPILGESRPAQGISYILSALIGSVLVYYSITGVARVIKRTGQRS